MAFALRPIFKCVETPPNSVWCSETCRRLFINRESAQAPQSNRRVKSARLKPVWKKVNILIYSKRSVCILQVLVMVGPAPAGSLSAL